MTAHLIAKWQAAGFVHGVMNTDNMSILGLTIDYGPYGWLDNYDPAWTPNTTDAEGRRYCFANQAQIAHWNLAQLGNALAPLFGSAEPLQQVLNSYPGYFEAGRRKMMADKLGFSDFIVETDDILVAELLAILASVETDMTIFYRRLALLDIEVGLDTVSNKVLTGHFSDAYYHPDQLSEVYQTRLAKWLRGYILRLRKDGKSNAARRAQMNAANPKYVLRNYLAQQAIDQAEAGNFALVNELMELLRHPYDEQAEHEAFAAKRPNWAKNRAGCSMLSCSS